MRSITLFLLFVLSSVAEVTPITFQYTERHLTVDKEGKVLADLIVRSDCGRRSDGATSCLTKEVNQIDRKVREFRRISIPGAKFDALVHGSSRQIYEVPPSNPLFFSPPDDNVNWKSAKFQQATVGGNSCVEIPIRGDAPGTSCYSPDHRMFLRKVMKTERPTKTYSSSYEVTSIKEQVPSPELFLAPKDFATIVCTTCKR